MNTLLWLTGLIFAALLPWGTNVPLQRRAVIVRTLVFLAVCVHLITQTYIHHAYVSPWSSQETRQAAAEAQASYAKYLDRFALTPSQLALQGGWRWLQLITANFIHTGWLHLAINIWLFAIYAPNLEDLFGRIRFGGFILLVMIVSQLTAYYLAGLLNWEDMPSGGFSGVVYAVIGAYLVCFPRSKIQVALIYDFKFWAAIAFLLCPAIYVFGQGSPSLAELVLLIGVVGLFVLLQPEHARFGLPAYTLLGYKVVQDALTFVAQAAHGINIWSHLGGLLIGVASALALNGMKGLKQTWDDPNAPSPKKGDRSQRNIAKLRTAAQTDVEAARAYLGQRVFVADAAGATEFYSQTVLKQWPEMRLDAREQNSLARMLEFKDHEVAALHAYELLFENGEVPRGFEDSLLNVAKLCYRVSPETRTLDALRYLQMFEDNAQMLRDRHEAKRVREEILAAAALRGEDPATLLAQASSKETRQMLTPAHSIPHASGYGGAGQPERRKAPRTATRIQQIQASPVTEVGATETGETQPALVAESAPPATSEESEAPGADRIRSATDQTGAAAEEERTGEDAAPPNTFWGKKRLPMKTSSRDFSAKRAKPSEFAAPASPQAPNQAPVIPPAIEKRAGLKRAPRVDLTGLNLPLQAEPVSTAPPDPVASEQHPGLEDLRRKGLDYAYGAPIENPVTPRPDGSETAIPAMGGSEMLDDDKAILTPSLRDEESTTHHGSAAQREASMKIGSEFAEAALGHSQSIAPHETPKPAPAGHRTHDIPVTPFPAEPAKTEHELVLLIPNLDGDYLPRDAAKQERALAILSQELCIAVTAESVRQDDGILRPAVELDACALVVKLQNTGVEARIVHSMPLALQRDPLEVLSLELMPDAILANTVEMGRTRVPYGSVVVVQQSHVRLGRSECSPARLLVELVCGEPISRRLQLHERTFSLGNSKHQGEPLGIATLEQMTNILVDRMGETNCVFREGEISYAENEALLKRLVLTTVASDF